MSIIIPARDEADSLVHLMHSLLTQTHRADEILIVDAGSTDATVEVARRFEGAGVRVLEIGPAYPGHARNLGVERARNDLIAFVDAGCTVNPEWLETLWTPVSNPEVRVVLGHYEPVVESEWDLAQALSVVAPVDPVSRTRPPSTASLLLRREVWAELGGFAEHLRAAEDLLFFEKLKALPDRQVARAPAAVARWRLAPGPRAAFRRLRLYSTHHAAAGLMRTWHHRVMVTDLLALLLLLGMQVSHWAGVVLLVGGSTRLLKTIWMRRLCCRDCCVWRPDRLARVTFLLLLADLAVWKGALGAAADMWRQSAARRFTSTD